MNRNRLAGISWQIELTKSKAGGATLELLDLAATGNAEAAKALYDVVWNAVNALDELCKVSPELLEPIARGKASWPGWLSVDADVKKHGKALVKSLNLGSNADLKYFGRGKKWTRGTTGTNVALNLYGILHSWWKEAQMPPRERGAFVRVKRTKRDGKYKKEFSRYAESRKLVSKLKPLSKKNADQWYEAAKPLFLARYGDKFEDHKRFATNRRNAENFSMAQGRKARKTVQQLILKSIKQGFNSIAPKLQ